jgi:hypothetical protein
MSTGVVEKARAYVKLIDETEWLCEPAYVDRELEVCRALLKAVEALEFYASRNNYGFTKAIYDDSGERARAVLADLKG